MKMQPDKQRISVNFILKNKIYSILQLSFLLSLFSLSCKDEGTPPIELPEGYQKDILWPSLADSPWPIYHGNSQSTGRSKLAGPSLGVIAYKIPVGELQAGITIGNDSTLYFGTSNEGYLYSMQYSGKINWKVPIAGEITSTPIITSDNTIIIATGGGKSIMAFNPDGTLKWKYKGEDLIYNLSLAIGKDGAIYFIDNSSTLHVLDKNGNLLWKLKDSRIQWGSNVAPVFSPDGKILYLQGISASLLAINIETQSVVWSFGNSTSSVSPIVDSDGNIYIMPNSRNSDSTFLYCLNNSGDIKWKFKFIPVYFSDNIEPTLDKFGNIYFGTDTLFSLTYQGKLRWKYGLEKNESITSSLVCDLEGNIYIGTAKNLYDLRIISFGSNGNVRWIIPIKDERLLGAGPSIFYNNTLLYPTFRSEHILVIK